MLFPIKEEENTMLINLEYAKLRNVVIDRISAYFENYQKQKELVEQSIVINKIFKKILLGKINCELNKKL